MNQAIVEGINKTVEEDDVLFHLGDWSFGGIHNIWEFFKEINCKNIHLVLGNHDHHVENNKVLPNVKEVEHPNLGMVDAFIDYPTTCTDVLHPVKAHDIFSSVSHYKEIKVDGQRICMGHYAFRVWNKSHHGSWNLHGHSHDTLPYMNTLGQDNLYMPEHLPLALQMDVGVDSAYRILGQYRPFSFTEVKNIMDNRKALLVDHHNQNTN